MDFSHIKGIVFDKDGTLLAFYETWKPRADALMKALCGDDQEQIHRLLVLAGYNPDADTFVADSILAAGNNANLAACWASVLELDEVQLEQLISKELSASSHMPGVPVRDLDHTIKALHEAGLVLGIATMDSEAGIASTMTQVKTLPLFAFAAGYDSGFGSKPEAGMVQAFCQHTGLSPMQVMVVGDNSHDMHMGRNANAGAVIGVLTGTSNRQKLSITADMVIDSVADLPMLLNQQQFQT